jgi:hypothetical protein
MTVRHRIFGSSTKSWEALCTEATEFASTVGRENLINISLGASGAGPRPSGSAGRG